MTYDTFNVIFIVSNEIGNDIWNHQVTYILFHKHTKQDLPAVSFLYDFRLDQRPGAPSGTLLDQIDFWRLFCILHISDDCCQGMPHSWSMVCQHGYTDDWLDMRSLTLLTNKMSYIWIDSITFTGYSLCFSSRIHFSWKQWDPLYAIFFHHFCHMPPFPS